MLVTRMYLDIAQNIFTRLIKEQADLATYKQEDKAGKLG